MVETLAANQISLETLHKKFHLRKSKTSDFFPEWHRNLPGLTEKEKQSLERVKSNYLSLSENNFLSEQMVKMVVLSPLLDLADFYQPPFQTKAEASVEVLAENEGILVKGNIDILVINQQFWALVIETKQSQFDVTVALPQALTYMLASPNPRGISYGALVNGREFMFVKLKQGEKPVYSRSYGLSIERNEELYQVLSALKNLSSQLTVE